MVNRLLKHLPVLVLLAAFVLLLLPERDVSAPPTAPDPLKTASDESTEKQNHQTNKDAAQKDPQTASGTTNFPSESCQIGGCSIGHHSIPALTSERFKQLLKAFRDQPISSESDAFEELIYFGRQTRAMLNALGTGPLDEERSAALKRELTKTHAYVSVRMTDSSGTVRLRTDRKKVPLGKSKHFPIQQTTNLQPPELSGTVYRTGVKHLWARY